MRQLILPAKAWLVSLALGYADPLARGLLFAVAIILAALMLVDPSVLLHRQFQTNRPLPDGAYVASKILYGNNPSYDVVVVGGSSMREMIPPPPSGAEWRGLCTNRAGLLNAATTSQQPVDGYAIFDAVADSPGVLVVGLTGRRLIGDRRNDPYALQDQSVELRRSSAAMSNAISNGRFDFASMDFFDQVRRSEWSFRTLALTMRGTIWPRRAQMDDRSAYSDEPMPAKDKQMQADKLLVASDAAGEGDREQVAEYWLDFARHVSSKGWRIVFVFTPTSAELASYDAYTRPLTDLALRQIASQYPLVDLRQSGPYAAADFHDPVHISHAGRDRLWPRLASAIRAMQSCQLSPKGWP